jgi:hypothetical protein
MKRETILGVSERAVKRALQNFMYAHPDAIPEKWIRSLEKRIVGELAVEIMRTTGHPPGPIRQQREENARDGS